MLPTHVIVGLAIAAPLLTVAPEFATAGLAGGLVGGILPDLDLYARHRRALHYPVGYLLGAVPAAVVAWLVPHPISVGTAFVFVAAAVHCRMDRYGGGLEVRPWEARSEKGVYDHVRGEWLPPRRWIRYDGSPEDLLLAVALGLPLLVALDGPFRWVLAASLAVGTVYAALRRRLADLAPVVFGLVPPPLDGHVPERYLDAPRESDGPGRDATDGRRATAAAGSND